ncbi:MoaF N-terminal domain-containing protein [Chromobacterium alkanivorans]|uniref:MoaF C-terminal domain-containing protein n=1 Tax=Chromobacterium alkanivorans TaxID=1071719 RepID=UPI0019682B02|nr:MoaF C-terminal domain-containing protein [Chromobacterium alkanivorans]MBN3006552.1 MoaF N-terminal domain-containing protein [Chromobacterium alkanivorans]
MSNPTPEFIQVGALADGFAPDSLTLPRCAELDGQSLRLCFDDDSAADCRLEPGGDARVVIVRPGLASTLAGVDGCHASSLRPGVYFLDFRHQGPAALSLSLVLDLTQRRFTLVRGNLPDAAAARICAFDRVAHQLELTGVDVEFLHGALDQPAAAVPPHPPSRDLIGMRNRYRYSPTECYEHIYLNDSFYAWHCLEGVERGLADVDRCHCLQVAERLYLFVWREKIIPTLGVILIDLEGMRTDGKIFGYQDGDFGAARNFRVGAQASIVNHTRA